MNAQNSEKHTSESKVGGTIFFCGGGGVGEQSQIECYHVKKQRKEKKMTLEDTCSFYLPWVNLLVSFSPVPYAGYFKGGVLRFVAGRDAAPALKNRSTGGGGGGGGLSDTLFSFLKKCWVNLPYMG